LRGVLVKKYDGLALCLKELPHDFYDPDMGDWPGVWLPYTVSNFTSCMSIDSDAKTDFQETGRVILDHKTFQEEQYGEHVDVTPFPAEGNSEKSLYEQRLLCSPYAIGYSLERKDWCRFYVDNIHKIEWNRNAFDTLILKEAPKRVLRALVSSHAFQDNVRDEAQQKGKGLVVLLHGEPGSGKTLTAGAFKLPIHLIWFIVC
jgi:hypothetical protein